jgi:hypothetical protein
MKQQDNEKTFLVEMDDRYPCYCTDELAYCNDTGKACGGDLNNRPSWCPLKPLREAKSHDYDRTMVWVEE